MDTIYTGQPKDISLVLKNDSGIAVDLTTASQIIGYIKHNNCIIAKFCSDDMLGFQTFDEFPIGYGHMHRDLEVTGKMILNFNRNMTTAKSFLITDYVDIEVAIWFSDTDIVLSKTNAFLRIEYSDVLLNEYKKII